jgi:large subunit ribosomal protein L23
MALFGKKKTEEKKNVAAKPVKEAKEGNEKKTAHSLRNAILRPRITEKAGIHSDKNVYTFVVSKNANKKTIAAEVKDIYKVTPVKVNIVNLPRTVKLVRGRRTDIPGLKKALVFLKEGDKIEFI